MLKIIHAADIHAPAGVPRTRPGESIGQAQRNRNRPVAHCRFAKREKANLLLLCGDLFEHSHARDLGKKAADLFRSIASTKVFITPGNHDPLVRDSLYRTVAWPENVVVFEGPEVGEHVLEDLNAAVYGLGWRTYLEHRRVLSGFRGGRKGFSTS